jgi:hypothetical protein
MAKQTTIPKVDEDFMRDVISQGFPMKKESLKGKDISVIIKEDKPAVKTRKTRNAPKQKQIEQTEYKEIYFEKINLTNRQQVSISKETHLILFSLASMIGGHGATISSYIENIILQHLESYKEELKDMYETQCRKPVL